MALCGDHELERYWPGLGEGVRFGEVFVQGGGEVGQGEIGVGEVLVEGVGVEIVQWRGWPDHGVPENGKKYFGVLVEAVKRRMENN